MSGSTEKRGVPGVLLVLFGLFAAAFVAFAVVFGVMMYEGYKFYASYGESYNKELKGITVIAIEPHDFTMGGDSLPGYLVRTDAEPLMIIPLVLQSKLEPVKILGDLTAGVKYDIIVTGNPPEGLPIYRAIVSHTKSN